MYLSFLGAAGTVTGSRFVLEQGRHRLLVDCGLFQGLKNLRLRNWAPFPVAPDKLGAVLLTHAHLDHSGYLPKLVKEGFTGPIFGTAATLDLLRILLPDSAKLMEKDAEFAKRRGYSKHKNPKPLYTARDVERCYRQFSPVAWERVARAPGGFAIHLRRAGHILGAASASIVAGGRSITFSGDLGRTGDPLLPDPHPPAASDYVVIESTYGNRIHPAEDPLDTLAAHIKRVHARGGKIIIPSFAVGRMQSLLWYLHRLKADARIPGLPVFVDSPMASSATELYARHGDDHRGDHGDCAAAFDAAHYVADPEESARLTARKGPCIILSASGMATGGRVLHHIRAAAPDTRNLILFAGFQAAGTRGADLVAGNRRIKMHGEYVDIFCEVAQLENASAHADADGLMAWLGRIPKPPRKVFVVHGEPTAADALRRRIGDELGFDAVVPEHGEKVEL
ncbi:MAG TPA: MBL fold metallo-hydrolase [Fibrobacteria bacterium]|nr:MBL fold metallo-hydrolase [Fibrobacteria bacterium]